jgi:hypothetical protein
VKSLSVYDNAVRSQHDVAIEVGGKSFQFKISKGKMIEYAWVGL